MYGDDRDEMNDRHRFDPVRPQHMTPCEECGYHYCGNCGATLRVATASETTEPVFESLPVSKKARIEELERELAQRKGWQQCEIHGEISADSAWGCPECVRELRAELQIAWAAGNRENDEKNALGRELEAARLRVAYWRKAAYGIHNESCNKTSCMEEFGGEAAMRPLWKCRDARLLVKVASIPLETPEP